MTLKKLCFFEGNGNTVLILDLQKETWTEKKIEKPGFEFGRTGQSVTLPDGDILITGGGFSASVYKYSPETNALVEKKSMN